MSWKFAGIIFRKDYRGSYPDLLKRLGVVSYQSAEGFTFSDAIRRENQATALGFVNGNTLLLHHFIPYDCSYEPGGKGRLDDILIPLSLEGDIMNYIIDGVSGTYCFSLFSKGERSRRWAVEPGNVWCNDGSMVNGEMPAVSKNAVTGNSLPDIFMVSDDEAHLFAVWEAFIGVSFQELVRNDTLLFHFFL
jgi:hypothetical protein